MKHSSTEDRWRRLLVEQERSGLNVRHFAEERGLSPWTVYGWRQRLGLGRRRAGRQQGPRRSPKGEGKLVPVQVIDSGGPAMDAGSGFHVELREGARIHVPRGFEPEEFARLVAVLRSSC